MNSRTLITAVTAFAVASSAFAYRSPSGTSYRAQPRVVDNRGVVGNNVGYGTSDRDLKQAIKAKRKQVHQLRKAGDPRAAQAEQELRVLQDQRRQSHGMNRNDRNANDRSADDRDLRQRNDRDDDREGDRVHEKRKKNEKHHEKKNEKHHEKNDENDDDDQDR